MAVASSAKFLAPSAAAVPLNAGFALGLLVGKQAGSHYQDNFLQEKVLSKQQHLPEGIPRHHRRLGVTAAAELMNGWMYSCAGQSQVNKHSCVFPDLTKKNYLLQTMWATLSYFVNQIS